MGEARSTVQVTRYVSVKRSFSIKLSILRIPSDTPRENQFRSSSETGVKVFFCYLDCIVVRFCLNSLVNFAKRFCWLLIRLGLAEGIGGGGGGKERASVPIKCFKIIKNGRERNCEKVAKTVKKSVNLTRNKRRLRTGTLLKRRVKMWLWRRKLINVTWEWWDMLERTILA